MIIGKVGTIQRPLCMGFQSLLYSTNSLPQISVNIDKVLNSKKNQKLNLANEVNLVKSGNGNINNWSDLTKLYNISDIGKSEAKKYTKYISEVSITSTEDSKLQSNIKFVNLSSKQSLTEKTKDFTKTMVDPNFDINFGTLKAYLSEKNYVFNAYNLVQNIKGTQDGFVTNNNNVLSQLTGLSSKMLFFTPKLSLDEIDNKIVQAFKNNLIGIVDSPNYPNFFLYKDFYFVVKNSQLLIISPAGQTMKEIRKQNTEILDKIRSSFCISSSSIFYHLDIKMNTISSASLINSLLKDVLTPQKQDMLNLVLMKTKKDKDIHDALTSFSPSKEYTFKLIQSLDADMNPEYKEKIDNIEETDTKLIIQKLKWICRTEPEMHHITSILSNFEDVEFTAVLKVYLWKTLVKLKSLKPNVISYQANITKAKSNSSGFTIPPQIPKDSLQITVFTDASLNNEVSATGQVYFVNNRLAYMQSVVDNEILSYIDGAELHAALSATKNVVIMKKFLKDFLKKTNKIKVISYIDNVSVLNAITLHKQSSYQKSDLRLYEYLNSVDFSEINTTYVPSECNVADGLTKKHFNSNLYSSVWFSQFMGKSNPISNSVINSALAKFRKVKILLKQFNELILSGKKNLQSLEEMELLYEQHSNDISKKEQILIELTEVGKDCLDQLKEADKTLEVLSKKFKIPLNKHKSKTSFDNLDMAMEALDKEVDYVKHAKLIIQEITSQKVTLSVKKTGIPEELLDALETRNNVLTLWELSMEDKIEEISTYFDKKERLKFKDITTKYSVIQEVQQQKKKRYDEWKEYLEVKDSLSVEEANKKLLDDFVKSADIMVKREEKATQEELNNVTIRQELEMMKEKQNEELKINFMDTLKSLSEFNEMKAKSQPISKEKQEQMAKLKAEIQRTIDEKKLAQKKRKAEAKERALLKPKEPVNVEVDFANTVSFTIGFDFYEAAGLQKSTALTTKQKAKLKSTIQRQHREAAHRRKLKEEDVRKQLLAVKRMIYNQHLGQYIHHYEKEEEENYKKEQRKLNGMF